MGQQQLLLLVLSTVIVGLATVAGIQAFSENQEKATQDALVQRAITIGNDVLAAHNEPSQFGGVDLNDGPSTAKVAKAAGYNGAGNDASLKIPADGAGDDAQCAITGVSSSNATATVVCNSQSGNDGTAQASSSSNYQSVTVTVNGTTDEVSASKINGSSV